MENYKTVKTQKKQILRWGPRTNFQVLVPLATLPLDSLMEIEVITNLHDEYEMTDEQVWTTLLQEMVRADVGLQDLTDNKVIQKTLGKVFNQYPDLGKLMRFWRTIYGSYSNSEDFRRSSDVGSPDKDMVKGAGMANAFSEKWEESLDVLLQHPDLHQLDLHLDEYVRRKLAQANSEMTDTHAQVKQQIEDLEANLKRLRHVEK